MFGGRPLFISRFKGRRFWMKAAVLGVIIGGVFWTIHRDKSDKLITTLVRPDVGEDTQFIELKVKDLEGNEYDVEIEVEANTPPEEVAEQRLIEAEKELDQIVLAENSSWNEVYSDLYFPELLKNDVSVKWEISDTMYLDSNGKVRRGLDAAEDQNVTVIAYLSWENFERKVEYNAVIQTEKVGWDKESLEKYLNEWMQQQDAKEITLPDKIGDTEVTYQSETENGLTAIIGTVFVVAAILAIGEQKKRTEQKKRELELEQDFPEIVEKMSILLSAGLTIYKAWEKLVLDYETTLKRGGKGRIAYEEMKATYFSMSGGMYERRAYEQFGERCRRASYRRLGYLLAQGLQTGNAGLLNLLERELIDAYQARKNLAKKKGEEAETKMIFPMMILMGLVMGIVMVPAFFQMGGG